MKRRDSGIVIPDVLLDHPAVDSATEMVDVAGSGTPFPVAEVIAAIGEVHVTSGIPEGSDKALVYITLGGVNVKNGERCAFTGGLTVGDAFETIRVIRSNAARVPIHLR